MTDFTEVRVHRRQKTKTTKNGCIHCKWTKKPEMYLSCVFDETCYGQVITNSDCYIFIASKRNPNTTSTIRAKKYYPYTINLVCKDHIDGPNSSLIFRCSLEQCERLIAMGFTAPRVLINVTKEHHHSWICLDQNTHDMELFDRLFGTVGGSSLPLEERIPSNVIKVTPKPYDTDTVQDMSINDFRNLCSFPTCSYYVFCDYSQNQVLLATA